MHLHLLSLGAFTIVSLEKSDRIFTTQKAKCILYSTYG